MTTILDIQRQVKLLGFDPGIVDGFIGPRTLDAIAAALRQVAPIQTITRSDALVPEEWMPPCKMDRVVVHWSAGTHTATEFDRGHYHILINGDGKVVRGLPAIEGNSAGGKGRKASHTRNLNTGSAALTTLLKVYVCGHMFDALISLGFNAGMGALSRSDVMARLNNGDYPAAGDEFLHIKNYSDGLLKRRTSERAMFRDAEYGDLSKVLCWQGNPRTTKPELIDFPPEEEG
jgi:GH24 family phage-related lysozyme (muramidase)